MNNELENEIKEKPVSELLREWEQAVKSPNCGDQYELTAKLVHITRPEYKQSTRNSTWKEYGWSKRKYRRNYHKFYHQTFENVYPLSLDQNTTNKHLWDINFSYWGVN